MHERIKILCDGKQIYLMIQDNERVSMLFIGLSRMGKTYFASKLGGELIKQGYHVHLIDLGDKWSAKDKRNLLSAGAVLRRVTKEGLILKFNSVREACGCGKIIANSLGFRSAKAVMVMQRAIKSLFILYRKQFTLVDLVKCLENTEGTAENREWQMKLWEHMDSCGELPDIIFQLDEGSDFSIENVIWDLSGLDDAYAQVVAYLINFCLLCQQKRKFRVGKTEGKIFIILDEFQVLDCNKRSIIGTCLTEGQKYGIALILITQFLMENFNETVIQQLKQGGFRFYFRLTEKEAAIVSKTLAGNHRESEELYRKLVSLPRGNCLMQGPHYIKNVDEIMEGYRFVEIKCD